MRSLHTSKNTTVPSPRRKIERESKQQLRQEAGEDEAEEVDAVLLWENDKWVVPRQLQDSEIQNGDIQLFVNEMLRRNDAYMGINRKRKASINSEGIQLMIGDIPETPSRLGGYIVNQTSDDSSDSSEGASSPPESIISFDSNTTISSPIFGKGAMSRDQAIINSLPEFVTRFSPKLMDEISLPMSGWNPTTMTLAPPRPPTLDNPTNQELLAIYMKLSAKRLADTSPSYIDLFRKYIPAMAHDSPALMEGILALAALQTGLMKKDLRMITVDAASHYQKSLKQHFRAVSDPDFRNKDTDSLLATSIILSHYEIWNGENVKMGVHMLGGRDIIVARGKAAHMTPVGRALYAAFKRADIATSSVSGNPTFMTSDWWTVDPFTRVPITHDSPILLAADAALSKLCVICCRLTYLKAWALKRRRDLWMKYGGNTSSEQKSRLQNIIESRVSKLDQELDSWYAEVPYWFKALDDDPATGENGEEEDINDTDITSITPRRYPHICVGLVLGWAIGVRVQLFRIRYPEIPVVPPHIGSLCHAALRIFAFLPNSTDASIVVPVFVVGMELRQRSHQEWLSTALKDRFEETGFHAMSFVRDGLRFAWLKLQGISNGRFNRIKEGAASKIDGVSENLWAAEGMLASLEKLSLYDSAEVSVKMKVFEGDIDVSGLPEDIIPYEATPEPPVSSHKPTKGKSLFSVSHPTTSSSSKRFKSESPEVSSQVSVNLRATSM